MTTTTTWSAAAAASVSQSFAPFIIAIIFHQSLVVCVCSLHLFADWQSESDCSVPYLYLYLLPFSFLSPYCVCLIHWPQNSSLGTVKSPSPPARPCKLKLFRQWKGGRERKLTAIQLPTNWEWGAIECIAAASPESLTESHIWLEHFSLSLSSEHDEVLQFGSLLLLVVN